MYRKRKRTLFALAVSLGMFAIGVYAAAETFQYHESIERGDDYTSRWIIEEKSGRISLTILQDNSDQLYTCVCTPDGAVVELSILDPDNGTDFTARREGDTVDFVGTVDGKKHNKKIEVEDLPWGNPIPILLKQQYHKIDAGLEFWVLDIYKGRPIYLKAEKVGSGNIEVLDRKYPADHIEIRLRGALSPFWVANYWIHRETQEFLKFDGDFGPGSQRTVMELMAVY